MDYSKICGDICRLTTVVGEFIASERKNFSFDKVELKGEQNLVSYVDRRAEEMIVEALRGMVPQAGFITEEGSATFDNQQYKWVIDPLDGTTNFIHGLPPYSVSIALMDGNEVVVGVIHEVFSKETFYAWQGSDAYCNGEQIHVSKTDSLHNSLIAFGLGYGKSNEETRKELESTLFFQEHSNGVRRLGSSAVNAAYVACGRFDAFVKRGLEPWDIAAGALICQRAGATISDMKGGDNYIFGRELIVATPKIYNEIFNTL